jgi:hypothetical protein
MVNDNIYFTDCSIYNHTVNATQCLRTLASPKGRGGMISGRLKYIKKKNFLFEQKDVEFCM